MKRILVVDDEPDMSRILADTFIAAGYEVETAASGHEALGKVRAFNPNLITMDIVMPDMNGMEVIYNLQRDEATRGIPIVIISVLENPKAPAWVAKPLPVIEFLTKPLDTEQLIDCTNLIMESRPPDAAPVSKKKVLVADGDKGFVEILKSFLHMKGFEVVVCNNGRSVLELARNEQPNAILLDIRLPEVDGFSVIDSLKKDPAVCQIPILIMTEENLSEFFGNGLWVAISRDPQTAKLHMEPLLREMERQLRLCERPHTPAVKTHILVADDEECINRVVHDIFQYEDFDVTTAFDGKDALEKIYSRSPDIAILDVNMPKMDGYEVCRRIKEDVLFQHMPVILLTAMQETKDKVYGLDCGADDYVTKPFVPEELLARVRMVLRRTSQTLEANPLSRLPGNVAIERKINQCIRQEIPFAVLYIDLNNFKAFNDRYGFEQGDRVIRATARLLLESIKETGGADDFIGHIGGDDFVVVTAPQRMEITANAIIKKFDLMVPGFYDEDDKKRGYIISTDRQNRQHQFPFLSVAIGIISSQNLKFRFYGEVSSVGTEMKKYAKQSQTSAYKIDMRH